MTLEELMNEPVTSVSKRETPLMFSAAAIAVVVPEDIRRLGITTLPEALRLVPGMDVARLTANKWAVTARGFNSQFANKLLVLIDGRAIYTPTFGGVYWDSQDILIEDMARIEVIRGPGATLWGANAVNGVINVVTKSAAQTQGLLVSAAAGTEDRPTVAVRYGGMMSPRLAFRVYGKFFSRTAFADAAGRATPDEWDAARGGLRIDAGEGTDTQTTFLAEYHEGRSGEFKQRASLTPPFSRAFDAVNRNRGGHALARWHRDFHAAGKLTLQAYYDRVGQNIGAELNQETRDTLDAEAQHRFTWRRHEIVWGLGYRVTHDRLPSNFGITWTPEEQRCHLWNAFVQDDITLVPDRWRLTLGTKLEKSERSGSELQPNVRLAWSPSPRLTAWAAMARAARTVSRFERGVRLNVAAFQPSPFGPVFLASLFGNPAAEAEILVAHEAGYRVELSKELVLDAAGFYNRYEDLLIFLPGPSRPEALPAPAHVLVAPSTIRNISGASTHGAELSLQWQPALRLKLAASYSWIRMSFGAHAPPEGHAPEHQVRLRSYFDLRPNLQLNAAAHYVSRRPKHRVDAQVRLDLGCTWRVNETLELGLWAQNLLDRSHPEFVGNSTSLRTEVPRTLVTRLTWKY